MSEVNPFSLVNKNILVTGASSGIGKETSVILSQMGAKLIITGRNAVRLNETFKLLSGTGHNQIVADLTIDSEVEGLILQLPKLDGLVSNAGIGNPLILQLTEKEDIKNLFEVNTFIPIHLTRQILQNKKLNKGASLVYISSINGYNCSSVGSSIYASTKSAINGFVKGIALELASRNIRVNTINPGMIETDFFKDTSIGDEELERDRLKYPLRRFGKPEEVAYAVVYLMSDKTQWITGSNLLIDGGYTLQ